MYLNLNFQLFKYQSDNMIISFFKTLHYRYSGFNVFKVIICNVSNFLVIKLCLQSVKTQVNVSYLTNIVSLLQFHTLNLCFLFPEITNSAEKKVQYVVLPGSCIS